MSVFTGYLCMSSLVNRVANHHSYGNWLVQTSLSWCWPKDTWALGTRLRRYARKSLSVALTVSYLSTCINPKKRSVRKRWLFHHGNERHGRFYSILDARRENLPPRLTLIICVWNATVKLTPMTHISGAPAARRVAKQSPTIGHTHIGKKRKPMSWFSHGYHGQRHCSWARMHDDGSGDDDVGSAWGAVKWRRKQQQGWSPFQAFFGMSENPLLQRRLDQGTLVDFIHKIEELTLKQELWKQNRCIPLQTLINWILVTQHSSRVMLK